MDMPTVYSPSVVDTGFTTAVLLSISLLTYTCKQAPFISTYTKQAPIQYS